jgi:hypothetical protein
MTIERFVIDASPLITLFRSGLEEILPALCPHIVAPDAVWQEVIIPSVADALRELKIVGLWLAPEIEQMLLEAAHEGGVQE